MHAHAHAHAPGWSLNQMVRSLTYSEPGGRPATTHTGLPCSARMHGRTGSLAAALGSCRVGSVSLNVWCYCQSRVRWLLVVGCIWCHVCTALSCTCRAATWTDTCWVWLPAESGYVTTIVTTLLQLAQPPVQHTTGFTATIAAQPPGLGVVASRCQQMRDFST